VVTADEREIEWQFDAPSTRAVSTWLGKPEGWADLGPVRVGARRAATQVDLYLDTSDWRFRRAGYALRIRRVGRRGEATLKSFDSDGPETPGLRNRRELTERLAAPEPKLLRKAGGEVGERVRAVAGTKPLRPLFEVRTRRRAFSVEADGLPPAELALDDTVIQPPGDAEPARLHRVEVEGPEATLEALEPFLGRLRADCKLEPGGESKYGTGLLAAGLGPPVPARFGSTAVTPELTIDAVALAVLRRHLSAMLENEPGTRLGDDVEALHRMRVATRRLRAALSLFADVLPPDAESANEELRWVGGALGAVRDLDVQLETLDEFPDLRALLERERATARAEMLAALDSRRYRAFVTAFGRLLRARRSAPDPPVPARAIAPDLIETRFRAMRKAGRGLRPASPTTDYHRLRNRSKRLRYALEFLADVYPGKTERLTKSVVALQDLLGEQQDAVVAIERLAQLAVDPSVGPETVFAMGELAERRRLGMAGLRKRFPATYDRVTGKRWTKLRNVLEKQRPEPPPPAVAPPEPSSVERPE